MENFSYCSTYDLKALLAVMTSLFKLDKLNLKDEKSTELAGILEYIVTSSQRLSKWIINVLNLSLVNFKK